MLLPTVHANDFLFRVEMYHETAHGRKIATCIFATCIWEMEVEVGEELLTCATDDVLKYSKYAGTQKVMKYRNKRRAKCKQRYLILSGIFRVALNFFSNRRKEYHNACHAKTGSVFVFTYHSDRH